MVQNIEGVFITSYNRGPKVVYYKLSSSRPLELISYTVPNNYEWIHYPEIKNGNKQIQEILSNNSNLVECKINDIEYSREVQAIPGETMTLIGLNCPTGNLLTTARFPARLIAVFPSGDFPSGEVFLIQEQYSSTLFIDKREDIVETKLATLSENPYDLHLQPVRFDLSAETENAGINIFPSGSTIFPFAITYGYNSINYFCFWNCKNEKIKK